MNDLFPDPAPDFSNPLGLLRACHQRIINHCETLEKLVDHIKDNGIDSDAKKAATQVHRYFSTAGVLHNRDEEEDIFPRLIRQSMKMADIIHGLKQEHEKLNALWQQLAPLLERPSSIEETPEFSQWVTEFCAGYRKHIKTEEEDFLSSAQHMLSSELLQQIGKSMKKRREQPG